MISITSAFVGLFLVNSCFCAAYPKNHKGIPRHHPVRISEFRPKIIGGHDVDIENYPYQLSLQARGEEIWCGASLIDDDWAVTAAHCTTGVPSSQLKVRAGSSFVDHGGQLVQIREKFEHPEYDENSIENDITLLLLREPVINKKAKPIPIATKPPNPKQVGVVSGWGTTVEGRPVFPDQLQAVELKIASDSSCLGEYEHDVYSNMFCAGEGDQKDSCQGDSGGPFAINGTLYGIVSWGNGCGGVPGVYTKVAPFRKFIKKVTKSQGHSIHYL